MRTMLLVVCGLVLTGVPVQAQNPWSDKMFKQGDGPPELSHDFGSVPHGTQQRTS